MRPLVLGLAFLTLAFPIALADHPANCSRPIDGSEEGTVVVEPTARVVSGNFLFNCIEIASDGAVTFLIAGAGEHDIRSSRDSGACFEAGDELGRHQTAGETLRVQLRYEPTGALSRVLGDGAVRACPGAPDLMRSDTEHAYVVYECDIHRSFAGIIAVRAA